VSETSSDDDEASDWIAVNAIRSGASSIGISMGGRARRASPESPSGRRSKGNQFCIEALEGRTGSRRSAQSPRNTGCRPQPRGVSNHRTFNRHAGHSAWTKRRTNSSWRPDPIVSPPRPSRPGATHPQSAEAHPLIRNSSRDRPDSIAAASQRGVRPRPDQVAPDAGS
jgi:hypothetical protein